MAVSTTTALTWGAFCLLLVWGVWVSRPHAAPASRDAAVAARAALARWSGLEQRLALSHDSVGVIDRRFTHVPDAHPAPQVRAGLAAIGPQPVPAGAPGLRAALAATLAPRHAVVMAAPGISTMDLFVTLTSLQRASPDAVALLIVSAAEARDVVQRVAAYGASGGSGLQLWLRVYDWDVLGSRLTVEQRAYLPPIRRYAMYALVLEDMASSSPDAVGGSSGVIYSNLDGEHLLPPHGVLMCDARDVAFQRDPFPQFWGYVAAQVRGDRRGGVPHPRGVFESAWAAASVVVVAGEPRMLTVGEDDWNRGWVSFCYYDLGEAMVGKEFIYCSGTTFATLPGALHYLRSGMLPAMGHCANIGWEKGMDQGIHNVLMHAYTPAALDDWRIRAAAGGPFRDGGGREPIIAQPREFLDLVQAFQREASIVVAEAEDGWVCTMGLLLYGGLHQEAATGNVLPAPGRPPCALVHQYDRSDALIDVFRRRFGQHAA